jgi:hypothetical protein
MPTAECEVCDTFMGLTESEAELDGPQLCQECHVIRACSNCGDITARVVPCLGCGDRFCPACNLAVVEDDDKPCQFWCMTCGGGEVMATFAARPGTP